MSDWTVSTADKKSVEEHEIWTKSGQTIRRVTGFRWGTWTVTTSDDNPPDFELRQTPSGNEDRDSIDMNDCSENNIEDVELENLDDGWYGDVTYPDGMDKDEQARLSELWEEDSYEAWESEGWYNSETEVWVWGKLNIEAA